jgi:3-hydroxyacyl-[acyl-carrier-protein] dehydratase
VPALDIEQIQQLIPHRPPFLWIDRVLDVNETAITAEKFLSPELPVFQGHYPDFPVFPGVLQCEMALQAGAILVAQSVQVEQGQVPVATRINNVKFRHLIRPGVTVRISARITERLANAFFFSGKISVDGKTTASLEFACTAAGFE